VLIVLGALVLLDAATTLVWQEPISALYARLQQDRLSGALARIERAPPTPVERQVLAQLPAERQRIAFLARTLQRHATGGSPVGSIHIPRLHASYVVVMGTGTSELEKGPGVYPETHLPGISGTTAIAGHRTTWLAPFRYIDALRPGDRIYLDMPYAHFTYLVTRQRVVAPSDVAAVLHPAGYSQLVLSACTPPFSAVQRLLVYARLARAVPVGAALLPPRASSPPGVWAAPAPLAAPASTGPSAPSKASPPVAVGTPIAAPALTAAPAPSVAPAPSTASAPVAGTAPPAEPD
jgi:sortase A